MKTYNLFGMIVLLSIVSIVSLTTTEVFAIGNNEWLDIDMEFTSANGYLTIACTKDSDVSFNMLMTVINYDTKQRLSVVSSSDDVVTETITLGDSMTQVFCEYTKSNGDKAGYAIMRTFIL